MFDPRDVLKHLLPHYVCVHAAVPRGEVWGHAFYSGAIVKTGGMTFWISAGHCIEELDDLVADEGAMFQLAIFDHGGISVLPFDYKSSRRSWDYKDVIIDGCEKTGCDHGAVLLAEYYGKNLSAMGVRPINPTEVRFPPEAHDIYWLVGMPGQYFRPSFERADKFEGAPISMPLERLEDDWQIDECPRLRFRPHPGYELPVDVQGDKLASVEGLSGSVIFAVKHLGLQSFGVAPFGIQSAAKGTQECYATALRSIADWVTGKAVELRESDQFG